MCVQKCVCKACPALKSQVCRRVPAASWELCACVVFSNMAAWHPWTLHRTRPPFTDPQHFRRGQGEAPQYHTDTRDESVCACVHSLTHSLTRDETLECNSTDHTRRRPLRQGKSRHTPCLREPGR